MNKYTDATKRLEIFGFNLKPVNHKLTQAALDAREVRNYSRLYKLLGKLKVLRLKQNRRVLNEYVIRRSS